jgi:hypothetical protein
MNPTFDYLQTASTVNCQTPSANLEPFSIAYSAEFSRHSSGFSIIRDVTNNNILDAVPPSTKLL